MRRSHTVLELEPRTGCPIGLMGSSEPIGLRTATSTSADDLPRVAASPTTVADRSCGANIPPSEKDSDGVEEVESTEELHRSSLYVNNEPLYLPRRGSRHLDEYLGSLPYVRSRVDQFQSVTALDDYADEVADEAMVEAQEALQQHTTSKTTTTSAVLTGSPPRSLTTPRLRCVNVLQGEVAHAVAEHADVLVSAQATTCHIVALQSRRRRRPHDGDTSCNNHTITSAGEDEATSSPPLTSLAHVASECADSLHAMIRQHLDHHERYTQRASAIIAPQQCSDETDDELGFFMDDIPADPSSTSNTQDESSSFLNDRYLPDLLQPESTTQPLLDDSIAPLIEMDLHLAGGYLDKEGRSQELSTWLIQCFSDLAVQYRHCIRMSLSTAVISSLNTTTTTTLNNVAHSREPVHRGLGIYVASGRVVGVNLVPAQCEGPAVDLRSARVFAHHDQQHYSEPSSSSSSFSSHMASSSPSSPLHLVHTIDGHMRVEPFAYTVEPQLAHHLLHVSDTVLLGLASTSPDTEGSEFCARLRRTVSFVLTTRPETVFGNRRPLVFTRSTTALNEWVPAV